MYVLPGTNIEVRELTYSAAEELFNSIFLTGGLVLSQVAGITECAPHVIQNWVKRGFVSPPVNKKYSKRQFCRIVFICFLKEIMQIDRVSALMGYINGHLDDESDDLVDDFTLYCYFIQTIGQLKDFREDSINAAVERTVADFGDDFVRGRLGDTLRVMATAYGASVLKARTSMIVNRLNL